MRPGGCILTRPFCLAKVISMVSLLLALTGALLVLNAWQTFRFERWFAAAHCSLPRVLLPPPPLPCPEHARRILRDARGREIDLLGRELPFLLERRVNAGWGTLEELAPTRQLRPRFENYGTDISVAPTICVC